MKHILLLCLLTNSMYASSIRELIRQKFCLSQRTLKNFDAAEDKERFIQLYKQKHLQKQSLLVESQGLCCWIGIALCCTWGFMGCTITHDNQCINPNSNYAAAMMGSCYGGCACLTCPIVGCLLDLNTPNQRHSDCNPLLQQLYDDCTCWQTTHTEMLSRLKKR